jgi:hypothetical protein
MVWFHHLIYQVRWSTANWKCYFHTLFAPDAYETMKEKLNDFDEDNDVIFPCGHPASMLLVGHALGELGIRAIKVLMYDKREKRNYPMRIDLW